MILVYVNDCIIVSKTEEGFSKTVKELQASFEVTNKGQITNYLGMRIERMEDGRIKLFQPHFIDTILWLLGLNEGSKGVKTPALSSVLLHRHEEAPKHSKH